MFRYVHHPGILTCHGELQGYWGGGTQVSSCSCGLVSWSISPFWSTILGNSTNYFMSWIYSCTLWRLQWHCPLQLCNYVRSEGSLSIEKHAVLREDLFKLSTISLWMSVGTTVCPSALARQLDTFSSEHPKAYYRVHLHCHLLSVHVLNVSR